MMGPARSTEKPQPPTRAAVAEHIAVEASSLARVAKLNDFTLLAYLIDMAVLEAWREAGEGAPGPATPDESLQASGED
jgi:hypothetical protein